MAGNRKVALIRLGILLALLGATLAWVLVSTFTAVNEASTRVRSHVNEIIAAHRIYDYQAEYLDALLIYAHGPAFDRNYTIGIRFLREPRFDRVQYASDVFDGMIEYAEGEGVTDVVEALREIKPHVDLVTLE